MRFLLVILFFFQSASQEYDYDIDADAKISREGVISIAGTTKLPDESVFTITLYYGKNDHVILARKIATVAGSKFAAKFDTFKDGVFPGTYTIEVLFDRYAQLPKVAGALGTYLQSWGKKFTASSGTEQDVEIIKSGLKECLFKWARDLDEVRKNMDSEFRRAIKGNDASAFVSKKEAWRSKISEITQKINSDFLKYNITKLGGAAGYVATLADILNKILNASENAMKNQKGAANILNRIDRISVNFTLKYQDAMRTLGMTKGQREKIDGILNEIDKKWLEFSQTADKEKWQMEFAILTMKLANAAPNLLDKEALALGECGNSLINNTVGSEKHFSAIMARIYEKLK